MSDVAHDARAVALAMLETAEAIEPADSSAPLVELARWCRDQERKADAERKAANAPLRAGIRANDTRWNPAVDGLQAAGRILREKIARFELERVEQAKALMGPSTSAEELPAIVALAAPRPEGAVITTRWDAQVQDIRAFLLWAAEQPDPSAWVTPNGAALRRYARENKSAPPGCRAEETKGTTIR